MFDIIKNSLTLTKDLIFMPKPHEILNGQRLFHPFLSYQQRWMKYFYPSDELNIQQNSWYYLQKYMMPIIMQNASSYHIEGIKRLYLNSEQQPDFDSFRELFYEQSNGFDLQLVDDEIEPNEYFSFIVQRKFPCIATMRPLSGVFCADKPDFWHEAIGHIAPLCFQEVQEFYMNIARYLLSAKTPIAYQQDLEIAWTLTEYGFLKEYGEIKMFGAALVGSHLANMRYLSGFIDTELADRNTIIQSDFYSELSPLPKNANGNFQYFYLNDLNINYLFRDSND